MAVSCLKLMYSTSGLFQWLGVASSSSAGVGPTTLYFRCRAQIKGFQTHGCMAQLCSQ